MQCYDMGKTAVAFMEILISNGVLLHMLKLFVNVNIAPIPHHIHHGRKQKRVGRCSRRSKYWLANIYNADRRLGCNFLALRLFCQSSYLWSLCQVSAVLVMAKQLVAGMCLLLVSQEGLNFSCP